MNQPGCNQTIQFYTRDSITGYVNRDLDVSSFRSPLIVDRRLVGDTMNYNTLEICDLIRTSRIAVDVIQPNSSSILQIVGFEFITFSGADIVGDVTFTDNVTIDGDLTVNGALSICNGALKGTLLAANGNTPDNQMQCFQPTGALAGYVLTYDPIAPLGLSWVNFAAGSVCTGLHDVTVGTGGMTDCQAPVLGTAGQILAYDGAAGQGVGTGVQWSATNAVDVTQLLGFNGTLPTWRAAGGANGNILQVTGGVPTWLANPAGDAVMVFDAGTSAWSVSPAVAGDVLAWDGATFVWTNFPINGIPTGITQGDMLYWNTGTTSWVLRPAVAGPGALLTNDGTGTPVWTTAATANHQLIEFNGLTYVVIGAPTQDNAMLFFDSAGAGTIQWTTSGAGVANNIMFIDPTTVAPRWFPSPVAGTDAVLIYDQSLAPESLAWTQPSVASSFLCTANGVDLSYAPTVAPVDNGQVLGVDDTGTGLPVWRAAGGVDGQVLTLAAGVPTWAAGFGSTMTAFSHAATAIPGGGNVSVSWASFGKFPAANPDYTIPGGVGTTFTINTAGTYLIQVSVQVNKDAPGGAITFTGRLRNTVGPVILKTGVTFPIDNQTADITIQYTTTIAVATTYDVNVLSSGAAGTQTTVAGQGNIFVTRMA